MKICMVAPVHIAGDVRVFYKEARSLAEVGHEVTLFARDDGTDTGSIRLKPTRAWSSRILRFLALPMLMVRVIATPAQVYHLHNPDTLPLVFALRALGRKVIYDTHENFAQRLLARRWLPRLLRPPVAFAVGALERLAAKVANGVLVTQETLAQSMPRARLLGNPPLVDEALIASARERANLADGPLRLIYIGDLSSPRQPERMIDLAAALIARDCPARLTIAGRLEAEDQLEHWKLRPGWEFSEYLGLLSRHDAYIRVVEADLGLHWLPAVVDLPDAYPNKVYEYLMLGTPVVASDFLSLRRVVQEQAGIQVPADAAVEEVAEAIIKLYADGGRERLAALGRNGALFVRERCNWHLEREKLFSLYDQLNTPDQPGDFKP